jgi:hypothetical protein
MSTSNQKVIPVSDVPLSQIETGTFGGDFDRLETEEDNGYRDDEPNIFELGKGSWQRDFERFRETLTYDYAKSYMRWFLESASCEITITVVD